jgi:hypothetical protein
MLPLIDDDLKHQGLTRTELPASAVAINFKRPVTLPCSSPSSDLDVYQHYSSAALFELTIRMIMFFSSEEILEWFQKGLGPWIFAVPGAYVRLHLRALGFNMTPIHSSRMA